MPGTTSKMQIMDKRKVLTDCINKQELRLPKPIPFFRFCFFYPESVIDLLATGMSIEQIEKRNSYKLFGFEKLRNTSSKIVGNCWKFETDEFKASNLLGVIVGKTFIRQDDYQGNILLNIEVDEEFPEYYHAAYRYYESLIINSEHQFVRRITNSIENLTPLLGATTYEIDHMMASPAV